MICMILDNFIIILLTILGLLQCKNPAVFIISASLLMIWRTGKSYDNETITNHKPFFSMIFMILFSVLSGGFTGFLVFALERNIRIRFRILLELIFYLVFCFLFESTTSVAEHIVSGLYYFLFFMLICAVYEVIEWAERKDAKGRNQLVQSNINELHEKRLNEQLMLRKSLDERNARLLERENISRNIHNSVGHSITAAIMALDAADMLYDVQPEKARQKMNDANARIRGSLDSIRRAVRVLDEENQMLLSNDLKEQLDAISKDFVMDTQIQIFQNYSAMADNISLPYDYVIFLVGVLQECLTNGVKHGNANEFMVFLSGDSAHIRLEVSDNGNSDFDKININSKIEHGFGLKKIVSYVEKCGGRTLFENENGFKTVVEFPFSEESSYVKTGCILEGKD